jgi:hypothetical protein
MKNSQQKDPNEGIDIPPDAPEEVLPDDSDLQSDSDVLSESKVMQLSNDPLINKKVFETRRKMAWMSLYTMIIIIAISYIYLVFVLGLYINNTDMMLSITESYKTHLDWVIDILGWGFISLSSVVLGYMGSTVVSHLGFLRKNKK